MFMQIHSELYVNDKEDYPVFLELVHNTDNDNLILFFVDDASDVIVREINLTEDLQDN